MKPAAIGVVTLALAGLIVGVSAQQFGAPRTILQRADISVPGHEVVEAVADFQPGATTGPHTHPGEMVGYILEGTVVVEQQGKAPMILAAGQTFIIPAGIVHNHTNGGHTVARILATYVVEKGKPLNVPAR
jgi:quercetin dioxygenase-like cupin family protein